MPTLTGTTCNEQCWTAREDDCHCSCGGANHGILRPDHPNYNGEQPRRNATFKGHRYLLTALGTYYETRQAGHAIEKRYYDSFEGRWQDRWRDENKNGEPVVYKRATPGQAARWPELKPFMDARDNEWERPYLAWIREDLRHLEEAG